MVHSTPSMTLKRRMGGEGGSLSQTLLIPLIMGLVCMLLVPALVVMCLVAVAQRQNEADVKIAAKEAEVLKHERTVPIPSPLPSLLRSARTTTHRHLVSSPSNPARSRTSTSVLPTSTPSRRSPPRVVSAKQPTSRTMGGPRRHRLKQDDINPPFGN